MIDSIFSMGELIASKVAETVTVETIKKWIGKGKEDTAKKNLVNLYEQMVLLERASLKFIQLLEDFIIQDQNRVSTQTHEPDPRWFAGWSHILELRLEEVIGQMRIVSESIDRLNPKAEIYLPDIIAGLKRIGAYHSIEHMGVVTIRRKGTTPQVHEETQAKDTPASEFVQYFGDIEYEELPSVASRIRDSVEMLSGTKKALAEFIRAEFKFSDL